VLCQNEATLVYLANQGCLTPHIWLSKINNINYPDRMIFDLDPSDNDFTTARKIALELREYLVDFGLHPFVMTTGSRGLHVVSPLKPTCTFDEVRSFARDLADYCAAKNGKKVTTAVRKEKRKGRLFIDTARNSYAATGVAPYAVRAVPGACVATPIEWDEVEDSKLKPGRYTIKNIFKRLDSHGDVWHAINAHATSLKKAQKKLAKLL
jgi:bifunctional non-homologous end joining protein LigD